MPAQVTPRRLYVISTAAMLAAIVAMFMALSGCGGPLAFAAGGSCPVGDTETFAGNVAWRSGTNFDMTLDHAGTAARTVTFPDNTGTVAELNLAQTFSAAQTFTGARVRLDETATLEQHNDSIAGNDGISGVVRKVIHKIDIADNTATNLFTITTAAAGGRLGGAWTVSIKGSAGEFRTNGSSQGGTSFEAFFMVVADNNGVHGISAVTVPYQSANVADDTAVFTAPTFTVVNTSTTVITVQITSDRTDISSTTDFAGVIEVIYNGVDEIPTIAVA